MRKAVLNHLLYSRLYQPLEGGWGKGERQCRRLAHQKPAQAGLERTCPRRTRGTRRPLRPGSGTGTGRGEPRRRLRLPGEGGPAQPRTGHAGEGRGGEARGARPGAAAGGVRKERRLLRGRRRQQRSGASPRRAEGCEEGPVPRRGERRRQRRGRGQAPPYLPAAAAPAWPEGAAHPSPRRTPLPAEGRRPLRPAPPPPAPPAAIGRAAGCQKAPPLPRPWRPIVLDRPQKGHGSTPIGCHSVPVGPPSGFYWSLRFAIFPFSGPIGSLPGYGGTSASCRGSAAADEAGIGREAEGAPPLPIGGASVLARNALATWWRSAQPGLAPKMAARRARRPRSRWEAPRSGAAPAPREPCECAGPARAARRRQPPPGDGGNRAGRPGWGASASPGTGSPAQGGRAAGVRGGESIPGPAGAAGAEPRSLRSAQVRYGKAAIELWNSLPLYWGA